ncbi:RNA polymerase sigma factor [Faecalibacterium prausnitzii]|uniref:RNA polymerase sigma factor n=1 Tax=Faecalibacterium prausnitzii TaxID=853 RepID=UPI001FAA9771|nr:sigma factor-like helix-turn-helix DNA-binding protein [Faecalibacterium prausnitzii]
MKTINLKKYYYPICKKDTFVEVPDEVADAIVEESRAENANDAKQHYHCYSLDASPGIENHFPEQVISPEDILMEKETEREQEAAHALMMERLREALATLTPRQASCLHARFLEGKQFKEIAEDEGFTTSAAIVTVRNAIIKLQKYYGNTAQIAYRESHSKLVCRAASIIPSVRLAGRINSGCQAGPVS